MFASKLRVAVVAAGAALSLSACVGPYGDIGMGYGSGGYYGGYGSGGYYGGYGSYGYSPYGYSSYGYSPYGYSPYGGWYDSYYYPGSGYYVYGRDGSRHRWSDSQRRYWENRRTSGDHNSLANVVGREIRRDQQVQQVQPTQQVQPVQRVQRVQRVDRSATSDRSPRTSGERAKNWRRRDSN